MLELINLFGLSNSPDLPIELHSEDPGSSSDESDSSSSSPHTSISEGIDKSQILSAEDNLVSYKKVEVGTVFYSERSTCYLKIIVQFIRSILF